MITKRQDGFYIESFKSGMSVDQFNRLMGELKEIRITSFMAIKNALIFAPKQAVKFGEAKERITVEISSDELRAYITLSVPEAEFSLDRRNNLIREILRCLNNKGVVFGIKLDHISENLCNNGQILAAEGIPPENGDDSVVRMYELKDPKPEIKEDGNVDHYELNLINKVEAGAWLGERLDPTPGIPGKSVKGNVINPMPGKKYPLLYDRTTVREEYENGVTTLFSTCSGAVIYDGERIGVSNHLEIASNVDFKTGNIDFDGFLTVNGSIEDNFSITANKDIEILGEYGVGSVKEIISREGSIYIKGGIAGKNKSVVRSKKDIYTKFISDATVICEGSLHIGYYCLNSNIIAKEVILDSLKGQIIGGSISAEIKVVSSIIGSPSEKRTYINIKGFNRAELKDRLEKVILEIENLKTLVARAKQEVSIYSNISQTTKDQKDAYEVIKDKFFSLRDRLKQCEDEKKLLINYLRTHGEGEVAILKKAYPSTVLELKKMTKELHKEVLCTTFYIQDMEIKQL